jgi:glutaconate CoA-transferase subunit B
VEKLDFLTTTGARTTHVITDLGVLEPDRDTKELTLTQVHEGVDPDEARERTGWDLRVADEPRVTEPPTAEELTALRELGSR